MAHDDRELLRTLRVLLVGASVGEELQKGEGVGHHLLADLLHSAAAAGAKAADELDDLCLEGEVGRQGVVAGGVEGEEQKVTDVGDHCVGLLL